MSEDTKELFIILGKQGSLGIRGLDSSERLRAKVAEKYASLDLEEEGIKIVSWLEVHRKRLCSAAFVLNWLKKAREQDDGRARDRALESARNGNVSSAERLRSSSAVGRQNYTPACPGEDPDGVIAQAGVSPVS